MSPWSYFFAAAVIAVTLPLPTFAQTNDERACSSGDAAACNRAGVAYRRARDEARAARSFERGCELGHADACSDFGYALQKGLGVEVDLRRGAAFYEKSCGLGSALGCFNLGHVYDRGRGVEADLPRAAELYRRSCDAAFALACTNLGVAYRHGRGLPKDAGRAFELMKRACDEGTPIACANLGEYHLLGVGVAVDYSKARALGSKSCDAGQARGCWVAAVASEGSDFTVIARWLERGCKGKHGRACADLGDLLAHAGEYRVSPGSPVATLPKDTKRARHLYDQACRLGYADGCTKRDWMDRSYRTRNGWAVLLPPGWKEKGPGTQTFTSPSSSSRLSIDAFEVPLEFELDERTAPEVLRSLVDAIAELGVAPRLEKSELVRYGETPALRYVIAVPDVEVTIRGVLLHLDEEVLSFECSLAATATGDAALCEETLASLRHAPE